MAGGAVTLWLPHLVTEALEDYIETLVPLPDYAAWTSPAWRRAEVPVHLQAQAGSSAPLAFSLQDDPVAVESQDEIALRYRAQLLVTWLYPLHPADVKACWRRALLAGHHLLAHLAQPSARMPRGISVLASRSTTIRRSPARGDYLVCDLSTSILYDSPLTWS